MTEPTRRSPKRASFDMLVSMTTANPIGAPARMTRRPTRLRLPEIAVQPKKTGGLQNAHDERRVVQLPLERTQHLHHRLVVTAMSPTVEERMLLQHVAEET